MVLCIPHTVTSGDISILWAGAHICRVRGREHLGQVDGVSQSYHEHSDSAKWLQLAGSSSNTGPPHCEVAVLMTEPL